MRPSIWLVHAARWLPAAAWMGGIFYLSNQSPPLGSIGDSIGPVPAHLGLYAGLGLLLYWSLDSGTSNHARAPTWVPAALAFALTVLYGALDELHQAFVPGRIASEADLAVDAVGALVGVAIALLLFGLLKIGRPEPEAASEPPPKGLP